MKLIKILLSIFISFCHLIPQKNTDLYKFIQTELIMANKGDIISLPEGIFLISRSLWGENLNNVIIQGKGIDNTVLNFESQIEGAEGFKIINSNNIVLKDFTVQNSRGDLIKVEDSKNVSFINIFTIIYYIYYQYLFFAVVYYLLLNHYV